MYVQPKINMMSILWLDFETRSRCDLNQEGAYNYALDLSTEALCLCYAFDDGDIETWRRGETFPVKVKEYKGQIRAHNAAFDRLIMTYVLGIETALEQWYCTATQARANCMPGKLGDLGRFAGLSMKKDHHGAKLIRWLSIPRADGTFNEDPKLMREMVEYCAQDVRAMRAASLSMREMTAEELWDYYVNERINDLGVLVDVDLCEAAINHSEEEKQDIERLVYDITNGEVPTVRSRNMCEWVYARVGIEGQKLMEQEDGKISINKSVRSNLLALAEENPDEVPVDAADVVQCAEDIWASSVAKFKRFSTLADVEDQRVRGSFVFAGGAATGRAASYGIQLHNISRKCSKNPEETRAAIVRGDELVPKHGQSVSEVLKGMLRPSIIPAPGYVFVAADWSAIEGRVNPWLYNHPDGEAKLDIYRGGKDPYIVNAAALYGTPYDEIYTGYKAGDRRYADIRQVGKVQELALGFAAGAGSFDNMAKVYGVRFNAHQVAEAIKVWRKENPWALGHGAVHEKAYFSALRHPNREFKAGRCVYMFDGTHLWYALPSGRILNYPFARFDDDGNISYAKSSWKPKADAKEWPRGRLWKGEALNHVTQGTANDLLRYALRELDDLYYRISMHIHDEIILEVPEADAEQAIQDITKIMTTPPDWAKGLPLETEAKVLHRFGK